ncbi:Cd(II)/Pb(II)-responsive transcriptional regulator [Rhodococcus sp. AW25M09]|uniref:MerR family transcriptional regulator n=1 Tax=Rhodococcus sp. AW25M09 TaxID=1268303 RepID=UPI0002AD0E9A|nr:MerR family transcriptional regulator [Rhodococcus sp. AW25M09]CCQ17528.1 Cd(II)/Pb(II)-responsive transcriptional regulator [Rhodococcus sp. AW25M09]
MDETFTISEVSAQTGLGVHALRFYERNDLLVDPIERTAGGQRRYSRTDVDWLRVCVKLRESGMPLAELRRFAELVRTGPGNEQERLNLLQQHQTRVREQLASINDCLQVIDTKVDIYRNHLDTGAPTDLWGRAPDEFA